MESREKQLPQRGANKRGVHSMAARKRRREVKRHKKIRRSRQRSHPLTHSYHPSTLRHRLARGDQAITAKDTRGQLRAKGTGGREGRAEGKSKGKGQSRGKVTRLEVGAHLLGAGVIRVESKRFAEVLEGLQREGGEGGKGVR